MGASQRAPGQRARPHLGRGPGGLRQGPLTLQVRLAGRDEPDLPCSWAHLLHEQDAGRDPFGGWRDAVATGSARQYGHAVPASMPAAFVLQWALEVAAEAGWWGARHHGGVVDPLRDGLSFALHPGWHHPVEVRVRDAGPAPALVEDPLAAARAAYLVAGARLAAGQEGVRLGRHQRLAMVPDVWAMVDARRRAQPPPARDSCCFIYVLPGAHECAGCPRLRRAAR